MGMVYVLRRATDEQLAMLLQRPELIESFIYHDWLEDAVVQTGLWEKLEKSFGFRRSFRPLGGLREEGDSVDLDKSWHLLHFMLTGSGDETGEAESFLVEDWPDIGDVHIGWGPAQAIESRAVARFGRALSRLPDEILRQRFRPHAMAAEDVYLADAFDDAAQGFEYAAYHLRTLRAFVSECVARRSGAIAYLT